MILNRPNKRKLKLITRMLVYAARGFAYHIFLALAGLPIALLLVAGHIALVTAYFPVYRTLVIPPGQMALR